ncbi:hypothetical protein D3C87_768410 [compost metagenome]
MAKETVRFAFTKGHTSFNIYSGSIRLNDWDACFIHETNVSTKVIRVTLYKSAEIAKEKHGKDARKLYVTHHPNSITKIIAAATRRYMGVERNKMAKFNGIEVPVYVVEQNDNLITFDVDLSGETVASLIKNAIRPISNGKKQSEKPVTKPVKEKQPKVPVETRVALARVVEPPAVKAQVHKIGHLTLPANLTLADLKRMNFTITIADSDNNPFIVETK